jgi:tRNA threonylcarbamoyladenosine dehydratase
MDPFEARFSGIQRLIGIAGAERLRHAHVCIVGLGGVGSWTAEALARSGIGQLTLVDFDEVCISNTNRQLHALSGAFGQPKVQVTAQRLQAINPDCAVHPIQAFFTPANAGTILGTPYQHVCDAIDRPAMKCLLVAECHRRNIPIITAGAAGGRQDPTAIRIADLARVTHDRLLLAVRKGLRADHGFPRAPHPFQVDCVYSPEPVVFPHSDGSVCSERPESPDLRLDCSSGYGTASFVTGAFGLAAAAYIVRQLTTAS